MLVTELIVSAVMIIRIYALYGRSARILWFLIGIALCLMALAVWSVMVSQHGHPITVLSGCHLSSVRSASYYLAISWECLFVFDTIIFGLTIYNGYLTRRGVGQDANMPIHRVMMRDGAMYFAAMAGANLVNLVTFVIPGPLISGSLATFATCMSVTMMTRLMLNLHERTEYGVMTLNLPDAQSELDFAVDEDGMSNNTNELEAGPILPLSRMRSRWSELTQEV
ncbi:hypothetical protein B0H19DRAFT_1272205 [Mycena capillaripes]|nr:hypothetical protein B0H19DRAFT_1272205 [Mycena capillaripes]